MSHPILPGIPASGHITPSMQQQAQGPGQAPPPIPTHSTGAIPVDRATKSFILNLRVFDEMDPRERDLLKARNANAHLMNSLNNISDPDAIRALGASNIRESDLAIAYDVLVGEPTAHRFLHLLRFVKPTYRPGSKTPALIETLTHFTQLYDKLQPHARESLLKIFQTLIENNTASVDSLCFEMVKQIRSGDATPANQALAEGVLRVLLANKDWLYGFPMIINTCFYCFATVVNDHWENAGLRQLELQFLDQLLRDRSADLVQIGREFVRLLYNLAARHQELRPFWIKLVENPQGFSATGKDLRQLLLQPTPRLFYTSRLTQKMAELLYFILENVPRPLTTPSGVTLPPGLMPESAHLEWFAQEYLSQPQQATLAADLVRFLCCVYHPSNQVIASGNIQRWNVLGWLLGRQNRNTHAFQTVVLACLFDWLVFQPQDNVMLVEPAMLLMLNQLKDPGAHSFSAPLLDFLAAGAGAGGPSAGGLDGGFLPSFRVLFLAGINNALCALRDKHVIRRPLAYLLGHPNLPVETVGRLKVRFPDFFRDPDPVRPVKLADVVDLGQSTFTEGLVAPGHRGGAGLGPSPGGTTPGTSAAEAHPGAAMSTPTSAAAPSSLPGSAPDTSASIAEQLMAQLTRMDQAEGSPTTGDVHQILDKLVQLAEKDPLQLDDAPVQAAGSLLLRILASSEPSLPTYAQASSHGDGSALGRLFSPVPNAAISAIIGFLFHHLTITPGLGSGSTAMAAAASANRMAGTLVRAILSQGPGPGAIDPLEAIRRPIAVAVILQRALTVARNERPPSVVSSSKRPAAEALARLSKDAWPLQDRLRELFAGLTSDPGSLLADAMIYLSGGSFSLEPGRALDFAWKALSVAPEPLPPSVTGLGLSCPPGSGFRVSQPLGQLLTRDPGMLLTLLQQVSADRVPQMLADLQGGSHALFDLCLPPLHILRASFFPAPWALFRGD
ncbi:hypothetical protein, variant [Fonticula alba]|uniref:Integrator complex subunit 3 N-terminal domain-containing protein n=1 Tax=Fonticula alba TaxID=691883 RepID=A0A058ZGA8_FONAL|nr:hypothetical protein, variant [Fonticula alba]KCV72507.1 hypothetical protein, variant [Fonticula alba]|eukprot:XP_009492208.1 hypothetical protein, variant [Fonticula alba]